MSDERRGMALELMLSQRMSVAQVTRTLGSSVSKATLYSLRRSFLKTSRAERKRKGGSQAKYTVRDAEVLCTIQDEHHDWTYPQLRDEWRLLTGKAAVRLSDGTINRMLKGGKFSTKQLYHEPASRNTPANIEARRAYALSASTWLDSEVVYIDEAGFNLHLTRRRGRSRIGERATIETVNSRGGNISICAAISPTLGVLQYKIRLGASNSEEFVAFLRETVREKLVLQTRSFHFVMDNVRFHKTEEVKAVFTERTPVHVQQFLPTYSPQLNAIEECWSKVKAQ